MESSVGTCRLLPATVAVVALGAGLSGCSGSGAGELAAAARDSAGIAIVENPWPDSADVAWWTIDDMPAVDIGGAEADESHAVFQVGGAARLSDGRIVVANGGTADLRYFGPDGRHVKTSGRRGGGPGEFQRPGPLFVLPGDTVLVADAAARRISALDESGAFVREVATSPVSGAASPFAPIGRLADGTLIGISPLIGPPDNLDSGVQRPDVAIIMVSQAATSPGGEAMDGADAVAPKRDTIMQVPGAERFIRVQASRGTIGSISIETPPFRKSTTFSTSGDALFVGTQDAPELRVYAKDGTLTRIVRTGMTMRPVTSRHIDAWIERAVADLEPARQLERREAIAALPAGDVVPPYGAIHVDAAGNLWVADYDDRLGPAGFWSIYDPEGRQLARIRLPAGIRIHEIGIDSILAVERDDFDVEHVRVYTLRK